MPVKAYPISTNVWLRPAAIEIGRCALLAMDLPNDVGARGDRLNSAGIDINSIHRAIDEVVERMHPMVS